MSTLGTANPPILAVASCGRGAPLEAQQKEPGGAWGVGQASGEGPSLSLRVGREENEAFILKTFPDILWVDDFLHHFEAMGNHCLLVFTGESSFQGFLGGAKWISSTFVYPQ